MPWSSGPEAPVPPGNFHSLYSRRAEAVSTARRDQALTWDPEAVDIHQQRTHRAGAGRHVPERIVQVRVVTSPARFRHAVDEHLAIIAALKARGAQESMEIMRRHFESARQSLVLLS
jgi:hypothetical protein